MYVVPALAGHESNQVIMKKLLALFGIIFLTVSCNPGNSGGVLICERARDISIGESVIRTESVTIGREKSTGKQKEPLLLLRILTEL